MPTLLRFLVLIGMLAGLVWAGAWALVIFVEPEQREISVSVPPQKMGK